MPFRSLLGCVRSLPDLLPLVEALGVERGWEVLTPPPAAATERAARIGRSGPVEWVAVEGPSATRLARRTCAALAAARRPALVLALDPLTRRLALAVALDRPTVCELALDQPTASDLERLERLGRARGTDGLAFLLHAREILASEDVGRRFFRAFRGTVDAMAGGVGRSLPPADRRTVALIQLTRVLFLYFVQAKGWLDGRPDFLPRAVERTVARGRRLHRDFFRPLFFGTLNRPASARGKAAAFGRMPFLNGGLFEPHPLERRWRGEIPDPLWLAAFDELFERFHFTIHESGADGRIAPDMLGRVFEGLMAPEDRRSTGAFYTPAPLVERMVEAALGAALAERMGVTLDRSAALLTEGASAARSAARGLTILDPAVGSGAFLLGALERLTRLHAGEAPPAALRRRIVTRNLFGVDRNPMAVRLAELRLWLAVIAEDDTTAPEAVAPLPNLDAQLRAGDSLLDPAHALAGLAGVPAAEATALRELRGAFVHATGGDKRALARRLRQAETRAFEAALESGSARVERQLVELMEAARAPSLFEARLPPSPQLRRQLRTLRQRQGELRRLARRLRREGEAPWFQVECQFADVMAAGGFDVVLGNPPWVRAEVLPPRMRSALASRYRWWRGAGRGFRHQPDLALAFLERAVELTAPGGVVAFLLPAKLATAQYASRCRGALARGATLHHLVDLTGDPLGRFEATTYPAALIVSRRRPAPDHEVRGSLSVGRGARQPQSALDERPWSLSDPGLAALAARLRSRFPPLERRFLPQLGVKTGANAVFLEPPPSVEPAVIRLALRGRDVRPFGVEPRLRLLYPHDARGAVLPRLPEGARLHLERHGRLLRARADYRDGPAWTLFRTGSALAPCRVVWSDLARQLHAAALLPPAADGIVPLNSCYLVAVERPEEAGALAAWLNCSWLRALARLEADPAGSGYARFNARVVGALPCPETIFADPRLARAGATLSQADLDELCAEHLALTPEDRLALVPAAGVDAADRGGSAATG